jgi:hypothetical protein
MPTCSTRSGAPEHALGAPPTRAALRRARAYKSHPSLDCTPPHATDPTQARARRSSPREQGASGRASHDHHRPANLAIPRPIRPSG